jgi:hypothetical protein
MSKKTTKTTKRRQITTSPSNKIYQASQTYWPLEESGKVRRANLHQIEHNLFDAKRFVNGHLGGMSTFSEDPTKPKVRLHDVSGEKTPFARIPLVRKVAYGVYQPVPASQKNAIQEIRSEAFQSSSSQQNAKLKKHLFQQQKGLCATCGEPLLLGEEGSVDSSKEALQSMLDCSSVLVDAREEKTLVRLVHATEECRLPWRRIPLREEHLHEESLPQVKFLHDLMVRQKVCLKTGKPFRRFEPEKGLSAEVYHNYQVALVPKKFYHSRMGRFNLSLPKQGIYPEAYRALREMLPEVSAKYLGTGKGAWSNAWAIVVLPVEFQHPLSNDSLPLRDFYLWLKGGESEAFQRLKAKFSMSMLKRKPQRLGSGRKGCTRVDHFIQVAVGFLIFYQHIMTHTQGDLSSPALSPSLPSRKNHEK